MAGLVSLTEAQELVLARVRALESERVPVERAAGRVLAEAARAVADLPPFRSSAMDGYAVRSGDLSPLPTTLAVRGEARAGRPYPGTVSTGEAVRISTGGAVPTGADAVVPVELTEGGDGAVVVRSAVPADANVRGIGGDVRSGDTVLEPGTVLAPAAVGALAAAGVAEVRCAKRPRVAILVTGGELRSPGAELAPGEIYESNGLLLAAALQSAGAVPAQLGVVEDERDEIVRASERALLAFDVLLTTGGASVGPHDLVREAQRGLRVEEVFWGVAVKPGKPVAFGVRRDHLVFNLPGNPVSVLVAFELLVRPALNALVGLPRPLPRLLSARLAAPVRRNAARHEFVRARALGEGEELLLEPLRGQESHMIVRAASADALLSVEPGEGELAAGELVRYLPLA
ncbi:MAG: molybdopterin molybdotransferase MoeA [Thermoleophilia bacterium]|nr:molybdopterin molybdotransferase MoeA [Thermoleophilia bacterium]